MAEATSSTPLDQIKAQGRAIFQLLIKPHTMPFHVAAVVVAGLVTTVFLVIILLLVMVATNFNLLDFIE